ncbi:hypothetical protein BGX21_005450, partial [Mortierella sp. AD011]
RSKRAKRQKKKILGKENADPDHITVDDNQGSYITGSCARQQEENGSSTHDSDLQNITSPAASEYDQLPDMSESLSARVNVSGGPMLGSQEISSTDVASERNTIDKGAQDEDELLSQKSTASECERSSSLSKGIYYLTGHGSKDCSKELWTPWFVNGRDLAPTLWKYRERVIDAAQRLAPLESSAERLAVNHIYLFEKNDTESALFDVVGLEDWRTVTHFTIEKLIDDTTILELQTLALELGNLTHRESENLILSLNGDTAVKKSLVGLVEDDFLWTSHPFNEHELLIHVFDPYLKAYICNIDGSVGQWDKAFPPSQHRKKILHENSLGRRPDFMLKTPLHGVPCYLFFMEAKKVRQGPSVVQDDFEKMAGMMKDSIDDMSNHGVDVSNLEVVGLHVVGAEGHLYTMKLAARGVYVLRSIADIHTPKSHFNFGVIPSTVNVLLNVQKLLKKSIVYILENLVAGDQGQDLTRPGFNTPARVLKA